MGPGFLGDTIRTFLMFLDTVVFFFIEHLLQLIFDLASIETIISMDVINEFINRMYLVIGVYMLFRISFALLNGVVNPDSLTDKEKGFGKMIARSVTAVLLLAFFPTIYSTAFRLQAALLPTLPQLILGKDFGLVYDSDDDGNITVNNEESAVSDVSDMGKAVTWTIYQTFFTLEPECSDNTDEVLTDSVGSITGATHVVNDRCSSDSSIYKYEYTSIIPIFAGIAIIFVLVGYVIDVAIRVFKLTILRILAPIPIISYIDPKSAKQGAFASFVKVFLSTYIDLFVKLAVLYVGIFFLSEITSLEVNLPGEEGSAMATRTGLVVVALIIGIFFFIKQAPKFIKDILGIKSPGTGIGLNASLAGASALLSGAGITGALAASTNALEAGSEAVAQGKAVGGGSQMGRDIAAQLKTGDPKAKGKTFAQKVASLPLKVRGNRAGFTDKNVEDAKTAMYGAQNAKTMVDGLKEKINSGQSLTNNEAAYMREYLTNNYGEKEIDAMSRDMSNNVTDVASWDNVQWTRLSNAETRNAGQAKTNFEEMAAQTELQGNRKVNDTYKSRRGGRRTAQQHSRRL